MSANHLGKDAPSPEGEPRADALSAELIDFIDGLFPMPKPQATIDPQLRTAQERKLYNTLRACRYRDKRHAWESTRNSRLYMVNLALNSPEPTASDFRHTLGSCQAGEDLLRLTQLPETATSQEGLDNVA